MAFDKTPTTWIANWSEDGTNITVPLATFPELTAAEADAATGDIRKILWAICTELYDVYADVASADLPTKMSIRKASSNTATGLREEYSFVFDTTYTGQEVEAE